MLKIILRKMQGKKAKAWKVEMAITRFDTGNKLIDKVDKKAKNTIGNNLQRLLQQTNEYLEPPLMDSVERKLYVLSTEKFKESTYSGEETSALFFKWNPTEDPFTIIPTVDLQGRTASCKLTIFCNNPIELSRLD
jgi:calpain